MTRLAWLLVAMVSAAPPGAFVDVPEGARIRSRPAAAARSLAVVDAAQPLQVIEWKEGWARVRYGSYTGWFLPEGDGGAPGSHTRREGPDQDRLKRALLHLERQGPAWPFGSFTLYTDVERREEILELEKTAAKLPGWYRARFGVEVPPPETPEAVVLYAKSSSYAALLATDVGPSAADLRGHAAEGVAAIAIASADDVEGRRGLLAHELTHLLNRRALGELLPPWLEEGMAVDVGISRFRRDGDPHPDTYRLQVTRERLATAEEVRDVVQRSGPAVSVRALVEKARARTLPPVSAIFPLSYADFISAERRGETYPLAALVVRFLLNDGVPSSAEVFRGFLRDVSGGASPSHERLLRQLGTDATAFDLAFRKWLGALRVGV